MQPRSCRRPAVLNRRQAGLACSCVDVVAAAGSCRVAVVRHEEEAAVAVELGELAAEELEAVGFLELTGSGREYP